MKKIVILIGSCRFNRGSEAIVRGCVESIRDAETDCEIIVSSGDAADTAVRIEGVSRFLSRFSYNRENKLIRYTVGVLRYVLHLKSLTNWINHYPLLKECKRANLILVIGGDNYDKAYGAFSDMNSLNKTLKKLAEGKMVFLNCSINADELDRKIIMDLKLFDKVTVREPDTYNILSRFLPDGKLEHYPDIAFKMEAAEISVPTCFQKGDVIGINLSSLILGKDYTECPDIVMAEYENIIGYIVFQLRKQVLLIPHVMNNADLSVLRKIYEKWKDNPNVYLIEDEGLSAPELKYIISKCYMYFGARTHSTIAAYSSFVPTLVLGYSAKAFGIAKDIFGSANGYVIPVQDVKRRNDIFDRFVEFAAKRDDTLEIVKCRMPEYLEKVKGYDKFFKEILFLPGQTETKESKAAITK